jgi:hypothetical protein
MNHFDVTKEYHSFDYQNVSFIALAMEEEYLDTNNNKAKEITSVKKWLKASANPNIDWIIPFFHGISRSIWWKMEIKNLLREIRIVKMGAMATEERMMIMMW